ncbi:MAG: hypothetical protein J6S69_01705 [Proteobacteria bacterium]|nr:hypothetical protein [Pseudomonadota bacterium]
MQEALESIFGPGVGLLGLVFMAFMLLPKFLRRWRGFHARKHGPADCRPRKVGVRRILGETDTNAADVDAHPEHGKAVVVLRENPKAAIIGGLLWMSPMIAALSFIPSDAYSVRSLAIALSIPLALIGLVTFMHCRDRAIFYQTGFVFYRKFRQRSLDYNMIVSVTEQPSIIPGMTASQILQLDDNQYMVMDGVYMQQGFRLKGLFGRLPPRVKGSDAEEKLREAKEGLQ